MKQIILLISTCLTVSLAGAQPFAMGDNTSEADYAKVLKAADRATRDLADLPTSYSLRKYAPAPMNQGDYGTCVAWSAGYAARTISYAIQRNMTNKDSINKYAFSPGYLYYKIKANDDVNCKKGSNINQAMGVMSKTGIMLKKEGLVDCTRNISDSAEKEKAAPYKIKDFVSICESFETITKNDILKMKKSLLENNPVVISFKVYNSFFKVSASGLWTPVDNDGYQGAHGMCVVGYNDTTAGGAFEIMNSWGKGWGNGGFAWITYNQLMKYGKFAVEMMDAETRELTAGPEILSGNMEFIKLDETTMPVRRVKVNTRSITVEDDESADYSLYKFTETYFGGQSFKIKFSTNAPSYIYVFGEDEKGIVSRLFPYNSTISAAINSTNATYYLPSETKHARLSKGYGKENICVLYSKSEIDFDALMNYIGSGNITIYQGVKDKLANRLLDIKEVKFGDDKISFEAPAEEKSVLCFFVELEHH